MRRDDREIVSAVIGHGEKVSVMSRSMWVFAVIFAIMAIAMIYQSESGGGIDRPWVGCKENLVQQMFSGDCTPRTRRGEGDSLERPSD
jgi:hypothetical protein